MRPPVLSFQHILAVLLLVTLSACAARPGMESLVPTEADERGTRLVHLYVATNRDRTGPDGIGYGSGRARLAFEEIAISVPPGHEPGRIEWTADSARDPSRSFVVVARTRLDEKEFLHRIAARTGRDGMAGVFVHGYNQPFEKAMFRAAQLAADVDGVAAPVLFSWPSEGAVTRYVADRDAAVYARDDLAHLMALLTRLPTRRKIALVGHSMGGWLTMEALRQLRLTGHDRVIARLEVALAAPDIDFDVFRKQLSVVGPLDPPLTVLVSADDRALALSRKVAGGHRRVGAVDVRDPHLAKIAIEHRLRIVDIASVSPTDGARHDRFVRYIALEGDRIAAEDVRSTVRQAGAFIFNAAGQVLSSPFTLAGRAIAGE